MVFLERTACALIFPIPTQLKLWHHLHVWSLNMKISNENSNDYCQHFKNSLKRETNSLWIGLSKYEAQGTMRKRTLSLKLKRAGWMCSLKKISKTKSILLITRQRENCKYSLWERNLIKCKMLKVRYYMKGKGNYKNFLLINKILIGQEPKVIDCKWQKYLKMCI